MGSYIFFAITGGILIKDVSGEIVQKYVVTPQLQEIKEQASSGNLNLEQEEIKEIKSEKPFIREEMMTLYSENPELSLS